MKKEVLLAIILGLIVGLVITYGVYNARKAVETIQSVSEQNDIETQIPVATDSGTLVLTAPEDNSIQALSDTIISGTTQPRSNVIVFVNDTPTFAESDTTGAFQIPTTLDSGSNVLTVFGIDREGKQVKHQRVVVVSSASLDIEEASKSASPSASQTKQASESAKQDAQQNIKERIEKVLEDKKGQVAQKATAYIGTIDRVTSETLTLNTLSGNKIIQIKSTTTFVDSQSQKTLKSTDLEIGNFAIVMGYLTEGSLDTRRIVISKTSLYPKPVNVIAGTFKSLEKSTLRMMLRTGKELLLQVSKAIRYENILQEKISLKTIEEGNPFLAVLDESVEGTPSATLIHLLVPLEEKEASTSGKNQ